MKNLKQYIKEEVIRLQEKEYKAPPELLDVLKNKLKMDPLNRFIDKFKAANTIPPSYRVFLLNGEFFDVYYESFSLLIKIGSKEYFVGDLDERNYAIKHINKLLTDPLLKSVGDEETETTGDTATPPPASPTPPEEPEA
tara:strand:+ start:847 stop:1263 length:417 start_codon:yes stop_codon:yes gene_type:complete